MAEVYINYRELLNEGKISGTKFNDIVNYSYTSSSGDDIKNQGLYYDTNTQRWYKDFYYTSDVDGVSFAMPIMMSVEQIGDVYTFKSSALVRQRTSDEWISKIGKSCGLTLTERGTQIIKNQAISELEDGDTTINNIKRVYGEDGNIVDFVVEETIDINQELLNPNPDAIDFVYDLFVNEFGDVSRNYELTERDFSEDGTYIVISNEDIGSTLAYIQQEDEMFGAFSPDQINELVKNIQSMDNQAVKNVFNHNFVRVMVRNAGLGAYSYYLHFIGYDVLNGTMNFTNEQGTMTVTDSDYIEVFFKLGEPERVERNGKVTASYSIPVYTTFTSSAFTLWGIPQGGGTTVLAAAYDMVSANGSKKPYDLTPDYVFPDVPPLRVSDEPDGDEPEPSQDYWEIGTPTPHPIRIKPPIGSVPPVPHDIPSEDTVPDVSEVQSTKGLTHVYNPTDGENGELEQFSAYLWDDSILTHLSQIWKNNPMDGIISAHELYFSPSVTSKQAIVLGNLTTPVSADVCTDRYQQLNCGYKYISRFWNDARDYQCKVSVYLPFIGFRDLDINDVLDSNVYIDYQIDIVTGDCTATISLQRKNASGNFIVTNGKPDKKVLYAFDGNCSVPIALSGADRNSMYSGVVGGAVGVVGGIASAFTGNVMGGISGVASGLSSVLGAKPSIEKSGNLGGNRGAMAFKKPYIIITRPIPNEPSKRAELLGKPTNKSVRLKDIKGYAKFKTVHVDTIGYASDSERDLIETMLLNGVIL